MELLPAMDSYESIDWPVVVLLGAMLTVGGALESTGATDQLADALTGLGAAVSPMLILGWPADPADHGSVSSDE